MFDPFYIYPRDKDGNPSGHVICVIHDDNGVIVQGTALCSEEDNFDKKVGKELAHERALDSYHKCRKVARKKYPAEDKCPALQEVEDQLASEKIEKDFHRKGKVKVSHYLSDSDKKKYPNNHDTISKVKVHMDAAGRHKVEVGASELDNTWTNPGKMFVSLTEDGYGVSYVNGKGDAFYIDYGDLHDLGLAINKFHELNKYAQFKRVK